MDDEVIALRRALGQWAERACEGLWAVAEDVLGESARQAPLDEGTLRGSPVLTMEVDGEAYTSLSQAKTAARMKAMTGTMPAIDAVIVYDLPYAAVQHEDLTLNHREGNAKYLEGPVNAAAGRLETIMELSTRAALS